MKTILLGLLLVFTAFTASAQSDSLAHTSEIRLHFGGAFPIGDFYSSDFEDTYTPFAISGPLAQVSYARSVGKNFYAGASLGLRRNEMDLSKFAEDTDELVLSKTSEPWQSMFTLADVEYRYYMLDGYLFIKGSAGAAFNRSASLNVATTYGTIAQPANNSTSFAYGLSSGMLVKLSRFGLGFEAGLLSTRPEFTFTDAQGTSTNYKLTMTTIHVGILGAYSF